MIMFGYIYKIWDNDDPSLVYYGSTKQQVSIRIGEHRTTKKYCTSKIIIERNNYQYATIEKVEYEDKFELHNRERWYIENNICVNKCIPNQTNAEYRNQNKEIIAEKQKEYKKQNKEKLAEKNKDYYEENKEKLAENQKEYYEENKEKFTEYQKEYRKQNKEKIAENKKEYRKQNKEKIAEKVTCECGCIARYDGMSRHKKTQTHLKKILLK